MAELAHRRHAGVRTYRNIRAGHAVRLAPEWNDLDAEEQARLRARQGVGQHRRPYGPGGRRRTGRTSPRTATTIGEIRLRGNNLMLGYLKDDAATAAAAPDGWFRSGDLGVRHPDGYIELRDRSKDVIISGGENITSIEVEQAIASHPAVLEVAVVGGARRALGRGAGRVRRPAPGRNGNRAGHHRPRQIADRPVQGAQAGRVRRTPAARPPERSRSTCSASASGPRATTEAPETHIAGRLLRRPAGMPSPTYGTGCFDSSTRPHSTQDRYARHGLPLAARPPRRTRPAGTLGLRRMYVADKCSVPAPSGQQRATFRTSGSSPATSWPSS